MNDSPSIALFGEAERGEFTKGYQIKTLEELQDFFGNPPIDSQGLYFAIQALHYCHTLIFFRVQDEGFSLSDYMQGLILLEKSPFIDKISAICTPGVGNMEIIDAIIPVCLNHHHIFITSEPDFYDYLSHSKQVLI
ncbi:hypothetical protein PHSC3_000929 [Chlamydiales bacterium STE3]|nr:hypothetical protein PHSC3_000929 [Chlamydiales bacterium STE3]